MAKHEAQAATAQRAKDAAAVADLQSAVADLASEMKVVSTISKAAATTFGWLKDGGGPQKSLAGVKLKGLKTAPFAAVRAWLCGGPVCDSADSD